MEGWAPDVGRLPRPARISQAVPGLVRHVADQQRRHPQYVVRHARHLRWRGDDHHRRGQQDARPFARAGEDREDPRRIAPRELPALRAQPRHAARRHPGGLFARRGRLHGGRGAGTRAARGLRSATPRNAMTRREFMAVNAALPPVMMMPARPAPPITKIEVFPVEYAVTSFFKFLPRPFRPAVFVKVTLESGLAGWGQSVPIQTWSYETPEAAAHTLR